MKLLRSLFTALLVLVSASLVEARRMAALSYQQLLDQSDLVIIATPLNTTDTKEEVDLPGYTAMRAIGVETAFQVSAVLKGDKALQRVVFHHYRAARVDVAYPNGPSLVAFDPAKKGPFLIFLKREADGRYAPTGGQTDPAFYAVHAIEGNL